MTGRTEQAKSIFLAAVMVMSVIAIGAAGFAGSAAAQTSGDLTLVEPAPNQDVIAGSANQSVSRISVDSDIGGALGGGETIYELPNGVTVNEAESDLNAFTSGDGLTVTGVEVINSGSAIRVSHDGQSNKDEVLRLDGLVVDTASDLSASTDNDGETLDITFDIQGNNADLGVFNAYKPKLAGSAENVNLGGSGQTLDEADDLSIDTANVSGQIANQTTVTLLANESNGLTWDTSLDPTSVVDTGSSSVDVDTSNIEVTANEITIPIESDAGAGNNQLNFDDSVLAVNTTGDATTSNNVKLGATVEAVESTGTVSVVSQAEVNIQAPGTTITFDSDNNAALSVEKDQQTLTQDIDVSPAAGDIGNDTNVTISLNNTGVTFDKSATPTVADDTGGANFPKGVEINQNNITVQFNGSQPSDLDSQGGETISFASVGLNVSENAEPGATVEISAEFQSASDSPVLEIADPDNFITINEPSATFDGNDQDVFVDNDGITGLKLTNLNLTENSDTTQIDSSFNATVSLPSDTGVTFDNRSTATDNGVDKQIVTPTELELELNDDSDVEIGNNIQFNVTADADEVVVPSATVYTGTTNYTVEFDDQLNVSTAEVSNVVSPADASTAVNTPTTETVTVESSELNQDGVDNKFGGSDVELSLNSQPDNADYTIDEVVNATTLTTDSSGDAVYNFSAAVTGDYVIDHNASGQANATTTYTVNSGTIASVSTAGAENAFAGGAENLDDNLQTGVYKVDALDSEGNLATTGTLEFRVLIDGQTSELIGLSDNLADDGTGNNANATITPTTNSLASSPLYSEGGSADNVFKYNASDDTTDEQGTFYVYVGNDVAEDIDVQIVPRGDSSDIDGATGTATFFRSTDSVTLDAPSSLSVGENVNATATAQTSGGTTIEVPRLSATFASDNGTVVTVENDFDTDTSGVATGNITADAAGVSNLTATVDSVDSESQSITVTNDTDTGSLTFNDQALANGAVTVEDVSTGQPSTVVVTYANNSENIVAGTAAANNLAGENVSVTIEDTGGFPGDHTAWVFNTSDLPSDLSIGDDATPVAGEALDSETANITQAEGGEGGQVPTDLQRFTGGDGTIDNIDVLSAVQAANSGTQISGQPVENLDVLSLVQYANSS